MEEKNVTQNSMRAWLLAARPKTLSGAAVPIMIGLSLAYADIGVGSFNVTAAILCALFAFIMQIDANFVNDYFDYVRGNDDETRLGPKRACAQGWITARNMMRAIVLTTFIACCLGLPLIFYGGIEMIAVGAVCVLFCFFIHNHPVIPGSWRLASTRIFRDCSSMRHLLHTDRLRNS